MQCLVLCLLLWVYSYIYVQTHEHMLDWLACVVATSEWWHVVVAIQWLMSMKILTPRNINFEVPQMQMMAIITSESLTFLPRFLRWQAFASIPLQVQSLILITTKAASCAVAILVTIQETNKLTNRVSKYAKHKAKTILKISPWSGSSVSLPTPPQPQHYLLHLRYDLCFRLFILGVMRIEQHATGLQGTCLWLYRCWLGPAENNPPPGPDLRNLKHFSISLRLLPTTVGGLHYS